MAYSSDRQLDVVRDGHISYIFLSIGTNLVDGTI